MFSLRDDYYGKLLIQAEREIPTFMADSRHYNLQPLNADEAREAIIRPLKEIPDIGFRTKFVDETLIPHLIGQGKDETKVDPPHLQIVCSQLYEAASLKYAASMADGEPALIDGNLYTDLGQTSGILRDYLDNVVNRVGGKNQEQVASENVSVLRSMLKLMIETGGTRKFVSVDSMASNLAEVSPSEITSFVKKMHESRVLEIKKTEAGLLEYSLSHEFMVEKVASWYDEREIERKRAEETLERGLVEYQKTESVLNARQLKLVEERIPQDALSEPASELVLKSKRKRERRRTLVGTGIAAFLVVFASSVVGWIYSRNALPNFMEFANRQGKRQELLDVALADFPGHAFLQQASSGRLNDVRGPAIDEQIRWQLTDDAVPSRRSLGRRARCCR